MRKSIVVPEPKGRPHLPGEWLDLPACARAELTSEDPSRPIESALGAVEGGGWRAQESGEQTLTLHFDGVMRISRVLLVFREEERARTQEFVLRWSSDGADYHEIVRQQYNFNPGSSQELEDYTVQLSGVRSLQLQIIPDIGNRRGGFASLAQLKISGAAM